MHDIEQALRVSGNAGYAIIRGRAICRGIATWKHGLVNILVRDSGTGLYLGSDGEWVAKAHAQKFGAIEEAGDEAARHEGAQVVLSYEKPKCELVLDPAYCAADVPPPRPSASPPRPS